MECPNGHHHLKKALFHQVEVDYCPECLGIWFDQHELAFAKDDKDKQLNCLDVDIWRDAVRFTVSKSSKYCPVDRMGLIEVGYDASNIKIDFCVFAQFQYLFGILSPNTRRSII